MSWSKALHADVAFCRGTEQALLYIAGPSDGERLTALAALRPPEGIANMARTAAMTNDPQLRAVVLDGVATYHAQTGDGKQGAGIANAIINFFDSDAETSADPIAQDIARKAIASATTSFSYGVIRGGRLDDAKMCADKLAAKLHAWGMIDAELTLETLAAEALYEQQKFDDARTRIPKQSPKDPAGSVRWERLKRLLFKPDPDGLPEKSIQSQYEETFKNIDKLLSLMRGNGFNSDFLNRLENQLNQERSAPPPDDATLLARLKGLIGMLSEMQQKLSEGGPGALRR
jgi:hypothetical protein